MKEKECRNLRHFFFCDALNKKIIFRAPSPYKHITILSDIFAIFACYAGRLTCTIARRCNDNRRIDVIMHDRCIRFFFVPFIHTIRDDVP